MEDALSTSSEKARRETNHILENLLYYDPEGEEDKPFIQVFRVLASIEGIDDLLTLSYENLRTLYDNLKKFKHYLTLQRPEQ